MPGLGRHPAIDPRNAQHPMHRKLAPVSALAAPDLKTWGFIGDVLDQGDTGTCTAHFAAHFIHCSPMAHRSFLNPYDLYREIVHLDEYSDNDHEANEMDNSKLQFGSSGTGAMKALEKRGLLAEYLWAQRLEDAIVWTLMRGPVGVGSNWYSSMFTPTKEGFLRVTPSAALVGGHQWTLRGWDKRRAVGLAVQSWGPAWNEGATGRWAGRKLRRGHFLIAQETLVRLFNEDGDAVSGVERKAA